jgi:hypothetical protein
MERTGMELFAAESGSGSVRYVGLLDPAPALQLAPNQTAYDGDE